MPRKRLNLGATFSVVTLLFLLFQNFETSSTVDLKDSSLYDFMVMDVCIDSNGKRLPHTAPGDRECLHRRNIRSGEKIPYHLRAFTGSTACKVRNGKVSKDNIPVTNAKGVTRIVSLYDKGVDHSCKGVKDDEPIFGVYERDREDLQDPSKSALRDDTNHSEGNSIQWLDAEYGFIMGSWSPVALSSWVTPSCREFPNTSQRSFRGWVIGPTKVPTVDGVYGFGNFTAIAFNEDTAEQLQQDLSTCPNDFGRPELTTWVKDKFQLTSGLVTSALISDHYSQGSASGTTPGDALQIERTYWTREFGVTRWEKWAREDWVHPVRGGSLDGLTAKQIAQMLYAGKNCNKPYGPTHVKAVTPDLITGPILDSGWDYRMALREAGKDGARHVWYLTQCSDYSMVVKDSTGGLDPTAWLNSVDQSFWAE